MTFVICENWRMTCQNVPHFVTMSREICEKTCFLSFILRCMSLKKKKIFTRKRKHSLIGFLRSLWLYPLFIRHSLNSPVFTWNSSSFVQFLLILRYWEYGMFLFKWSVLARRMVFPAVLYNVMWTEPSSSIDSSISRKTMLLTPKTWVNFKFQLFWFSINKKSLNSSYVLCQNNHQETWKNKPNNGLEKISLSHPEVQFCIARGTSHPHGHTLTWMWSVPSNIKNERSSMINLLKSQSFWFCSLRNIKEQSHCLNTLFAWL